MKPALQTLKAWTKRTLLRPWMTCAGPVDRPFVALTFDDGPHPTHTPQVLDVLDRFGAKATFFCVGERLREHPRIVDEMIRRGHEVANHSMTHAEFAGLGYDGIAREFDEVNALRDAGGRPLVSSGFVRPPKGVINAGVLRYCSARHVHIAYWNRDPKDYATHSVGEAMTGFDQQPLVAGDIVLLHDKMPHSAELVEALLSAMQSSRLRAVTVSALLGVHTTPQA